MSLLTLLAPASGGGGSTVDLGTAALADDVALAGNLSASVSLAGTLADDISLSGTLGRVNLLGAATLADDTTLAGALNLHVGLTGALADDVALGGSLTGGYPVYPSATPWLIEVQLYDETGQGDYTILDRATNVAWRDELSRTGTGSFSIPDYQADQITPRRVVKFAWQGLIWFGIRITADSCQAATDGTRMVGVSGPGLLDMVGDAVVRPEYGLARLSGPERRFGYMSKDGPWNDAPWGTSVYTPYTLATEKQHYPHRRWPAFPIGFPDDQAAWIGANVVTADPGYSWFRKEFTTGAAYAAVRCTASSDDDFEVYLDGELITSATGDWTVMNETYTGDQVAFPAAAHVIAARVTDNSHYPTERSHGEVVISLLEIKNQDDVKTGADSVLGAVIVHTDNTWQVLADIVAQAGWARGQVLATCLAEAYTQGIGSILAITRDFDETHDSNGDPWTDKGDYSFPVGSTLSQVVEQLTEADLDVDFDAAFMELHAWARKGVDRTSGDGLVELKLAVNLAEYETSRTSDIVTVLLGHLGDNTWIEVSDPTGVAKWGKVERRVDVAATADARTARLALLAVLAGTADEQLNLTAKPGVLTGATPYLDYQNGDTILVPGHRGVGQIPARVLAINVAQDGEGVSAWPELAYDAATGSFTDRPPDGAPTAPQGVYVTTPGTASSHTATLHWAMPISDGGAAITGYTLTLSGTHGTLPTPGASATTAALTGLVDATVYTGTVRATNAHGEGTAATFTFTSDSATPPSPPPPPPAGIIFGINVDSGSGGLYTSVATRTSQYVSWPACRGPYYRTNMPAVFPRAQMDALSPNGIWQVSFKDAVADVLAGAIDARIRAWIGALAPGEILYLTYWHEPNAELAGGLFTATQFKAAQYHLASLIDGTPCAGTAICMPCYTAPPNASWSDDWLVDVDLMGSRAILGWDKYGNAPPAISTARDISKPYDGLYPTPAATYSRMLQLTADNGWANRWGITEMNAPRRTADVAETLRLQWWQDAIAYVSDGGAAGPPNHIFVWEGAGVQFDQNVYHANVRDYLSGLMGN